MLHRWSPPCLGKGTCLKLQGTCYLADGPLKFLLKNVAGHGQGSCLLRSRAEWKWHSRTCKESSLGSAEAGTSPQTSPPPGTHVGLESSSSKLNSLLKYIFRLYVLPGSPLDSGMKRQATSWEQG
jgi:hypothetical protein